MARKPKTSSSIQPSLLDGGISTAPCVPKIKAAVDVWRANGYPGITSTTRELLNHWFRPGGHRRPNGTIFEYHDGQREAIETIIWLHEVARVDDNNGLIEQFSAQPGVRLLQYSSVTRRAIKMATGTGKTKVLSMIVVWHTLNAWLEDAGRYATTFLVLAPNVIVYERLVDDFRNGRVFRSDPMIPDSLAVYGFLNEFRCYLKGDPEGVGSRAALYLTNVQQIQDEPEELPSFEEDPIFNIGAGAIKATSKTKDMSAKDFPARIAARGGLIAVLNDEGHHTHDEESAWNKSIRRLDDQANGRVLVQYDVSATPRHNSGSLFAWIVYDFPLRRAIAEGLVKRPIVGTSADLKPIPSSVASTQYQLYLAAGVGRWRDYRDALRPLGKNPVLFVMANKTTEADEIADWMRRTYPGDFGGEALHVIHTKKDGEMSDEQLKVARDVARKVDDDNSGVNAIVSVLMLREGWDVKNVTVIVGLRPYNSAAQILPEQTVGRGLRLMFRGLNPSYQERVDVIGTEGFIELIRQLEKEEGFELEQQDLAQPLVIKDIYPDVESKLALDIGLPVLSPILVRRSSLSDDIAAIDVTAMACPRLPRGVATDGADETFHYEGVDLLTLETLVKAEYEVPVARTSGEVVAFYAKLIAQDVKLPSLFHVLALKVKEYLAKRAFAEPVDLDGPGMIAAISTNVAQHVVKREFAKVLRPLVLQEQTPQIVSEPRLLSATPPFPHGRQAFPSTKTIFNLCATDNGFEDRFGRFLDAASDVVSFAKLPRAFRFAIDYADSSFRLRYYETDFLAMLSDGSTWILETKGREDMKIREEDFESLLPKSFSELVALAT